MNVFISSSGSRSHSVAQALYEWLPKVIQSLRPWMAPADINKGARWASELADQLKDAQFGILCLTADNLNSRWIHFEAGALSKMLQEAYVCPYLLDVTPEELEWPLAQFQATRANMEETRQLIHHINRAQNMTSLTKERVDEAFDRWWPDLSVKLSAVPADEKQQRPNRSQDEMLAEILELVREQSRGGLRERITADKSSISAELSRVITEEIDPKLSRVYRFHAAGLIDVRERMDTDIETDFGEAAREIRILQTWIPDFVGVLHQLERAVARGCRMRILLLDPGSQFAPIRSREIGFPNPDTVAQNIEGNIRDLTKLCQDHPEFAKRIELRLYDGTPVLSLYTSDDTYTLGLFWRETRAVQGPQFIIEGAASYLAKAADRHFESVWRGATRRSIITNTGGDE